MRCFPPTISIEQNTDPRMSSSSVSRVILRSSSRGILSKRRIFSFGAKDLLPTKRGLSSVPQKASGTQSPKDTIKPDYSWLYLAASSTLLVTAASSVSCEAAVDEKKEKYPTKVQSQQSPTTKAKIPPPARPMRRLVSAVLPKRSNSRAMGWIVTPMGFWPQGRWIW